MNDSHKCGELNLLNCIGTIVICQPSVITAVDKIQCRVAARNNM